MQERFPWRKPRDPREVLNGILWVLRTGAPWKDLPDRCPPHQTCHRRFQQWIKAGVFRRIIEELAVDLQERGGIDIREAFIDGSFVPAKGLGSGYLPNDNLKLRLQRTIRGALQVLDRNFSLKMTRFFLAFRAFFWRQVLFHEPIPLFRFELNKGQFASQTA